MFRRILSWFNGGAAREFRRGWRDCTEMLEDHTLSELEEQFERSTWHEPYDSGFNARLKAERTKIDPYDSL